MNYFRTYFHNNRRYGFYQPNGYGQTYPGQNQPDQYPGNTGLGDDRFKYDPVRLCLIEFMTAPMSLTSGDLCKDGLIN